MNKPIVPRQIRKVFEGRILTVSVESITLPRGERLGRRSFVIRAQWC